VPPNVTACIFWLKNRRSDLWRDRHEIANKLPPRTGKSIAELRDELLQDMVEAGLVTLLPRHFGSLFFRRNQQKPHFSRDLSQKSRFLFQRTLPK
jgi:hypothetical protein